MRPVLRVRRAGKGAAVKARPRKRVRVAGKGAAVLLVTPWPIYLQALPEWLATRSAPLLFVDARGILRAVKRAACVTYLGVGTRPARDGSPG